MNNDEVLIQLGNRLRERRKSLGQTLQETALKMNYNSPSSISKLESGVYSLSTIKSNAKLIENAYHINLSEQIKEIETELYKNNSYSYLNNNCNPYDKLLSKMGLKDDINHFQELIYRYAAIENPAGLYPTFRQGLSEVVDMVKLYNNKIRKELRIEEFLIDHDAPDDITFSHIDNSMIVFYNFQTGDYFSLYNPGFFDNNFSLLLGFGYIPINYFKLLLSSEDKYSQEIKSQFNGVFEKLTVLLNNLKIASRKKAIYLPISYIRCNTYLALEFEECNTYLALSFEKGICSPVYISKFKTYRHLFEVHDFDKHTFLKTVNTDDAMIYDIPLDLRDNIFLNFSPVYYRCSSLSDSWEPRAEIMPKDLNLDKQSKMIYEDSISLLNDYYREDKGNRDIYYWLENNLINFELGISDNIPKIILKDYINKMKIINQKIHDLLR